MFSKCILICCLVCALVANFLLFRVHRGNVEAIENLKLQIDSMAKLQPMASEDSESLSELRRELEAQKLANRDIYRLRAEHEALRAQEADRRAELQDVNSVREHNLQLSTEVFELRTQLGIATNALALSSDALREQNDLLRTYIKTQSVTYAALLSKESGVFVGSYSMLPDEVLRIVTPESFLDMEAILTRFDAGASEEELIKEFGYVVKNPAVQHRLEVARRTRDRGETPR